MFLAAGKRHKKEAQKRMMLEYSQSTDETGDMNIEFPFYSFKDIVVATDNFSDSNMLGKGGFGKVYKVQFSNLDKSVATPIACSEEDIDQVCSVLSCGIEGFPCRYLGIPLSVYKLRRSVEQGLIDAIAARIPLWKGKMLNVVGRMALTNATLSVVSMHTSIAIGLSQWALKHIDKLRRAFIWGGEQSIGGGKCKVAWTIVCRPRDLGGLGVVDLKRAGIALITRWAWRQRVDQGRLASSLPEKKDKMVMAIFLAATVSVIGSGESTFFWTDNWIDGRSLQALAPALFGAVATRCRKALVSESLPGRAWVRHLTGAFTVPVIVEFMQVWR
jgi:hypothetical protein